MSGWAKIGLLIAIVIGVVYLAVGGWAGIQATVDDGAPLVGAWSGDVDGDRIPTEWESAGQTDTGMPLPGTAPGQKDLYVAVVYSEGIDPLTQSEIDDLEQTWARMPVENPDGSMGIDLHVVDEPPVGGELDESVTASSRAEMEAVMEEVYDGNDFGGRECLFHVAVAADIDAAHAGIGVSPGYSVVFDGDGRSRTQVLTHELLHNVVGDRVGTRSNGYHTAMGYLSATTGRSLSLSPPSQQALESGFQSTSGYELPCE